MFQTLVIIASIVVLSAAILTSTIVSAKNALHQIVVAKTQTAMNDATSQFQFWAQKFVAQNGTEADWNSPSSQQAPIFRSMCVGVPVNCNYYETLQWKVTGATSGFPAVAGPTSEAVSTAQNMTPAVDEQRVSATITVVVSDATGRTLYGGRSEEVTARVFDVAPYVVVTGTRDLGSDAGATNQSEGDSGGAKAKLPGTLDAAPIAGDPSGYVSTVVRAIVDCGNSASFDEANPESPEDNATDLFDARFHTGGNLVWAYQMPCTPAYGVPSAPASATNYQPPIGATYQINASDSNAFWQKGDSDQSSFPR